MVATACIKLGDLMNTRLQVGTYVGWRRRMMMVLMMVDKSFGFHRGISRNQPTVERRPQ
jgi:hypothetical protein